MVRRWAAVVAEILSGVYAQVLSHCAKLCTIFQDVRA